MLEKVRHFNRMVDPHGRVDTQTTMAVEIPACFLTRSNKDPQVVYSSLSVIWLLQSAVKCQPYQLTSKSHTSGPEELAVGSPCGNSSLRRHYAYIQLSKVQYNASIVDSAGSAVVQAVVPVRGGVELVIYSLINTAVRV